MFSPSHGNTLFLIILIIRFNYTIRHTGCKVTKKVAYSALFLKKNALSVKKRSQKDA